MVAFAKSDYHLVIIVAPLPGSAAAGTERRPQNSIGAEFQPTVGLAAIMQPLPPPPACEMPKRPHLSLAGACHGSGLNFWMRPRVSSDIRFSFSAVASGIPPLGSALRRWPPAASDRWSVHRAAQHPFADHAERNQPYDVEPSLAKTCKSFGQLLFPRHLLQRCRQHSPNRIRRGIRMEFNGVECGRMLFSLTL